HVRELTIVPDRTDEKRLLVLGCAIHELQLRRAFLLVARDGIGGPPAFCFKSLTRGRRLGLDTFALSVGVVLGLCARRVRIWGHVDLEIGHRVALFRKQKRVDGTAGSDEIQVRGGPFLRGLDVRDVVRRADDPEIPIAGYNIQDLVIVWKQDHGRVADTRLQRDDAVRRRRHLTNSCCLPRRDQSGSSCRGCHCDHESETAKNTRATCGHCPSPPDYADATNRSKPASKPYRSESSARRSLSMGVLV